MKMTGASLLAPSIRKYCFTASNIFNYSFLRYYCFLFLEYRKPEGGYRLVEPTGQYPDVIAIIDILVGIIG